MIMTPFFFTTYSPRRAGTSAGLRPPERALLRPDSAERFELQDLEAQHPAHRPTAVTRAAWSGYLKAHRHFLGALGVLLAIIGGVGLAKKL